MSQNNLENPVHKFILYKGNNSKLIKNALLQRGNWEQLK